MFVLNTLSHKLLGMNQPEGWVQTIESWIRTDRKLGSNRLGTKRPWVRNDW